MAALLAGDKGSWITGQIIGIDRALGLAHQGLEPWPARCGSFSAIS